MSDTPHLDMPLLAEGQSTGEVTHNEAVNRLDGLVHLSVKDRDLSTPPGSPAAGDRYLVKATGTGDWSGHDGEVAMYYGGWVFQAPAEGFRMWVDDEDLLLAYDGSSWGIVQQGDKLIRSAETGITASTTQSQGQQPLTKDLNEVSTVANPNDVVTLPSAEAGRVVFVRNQGASTLQIFPASGDRIDALAVDASDTVLSGASKKYHAVDGTRWYT